MPQMSKTCKDCNHWRRGGSFSHHPSPGSESMEKENGAVIHCTTKPDATHGLCLHPVMGSDYIWDWRRTRLGLPSTGVFATSDEERGDLLVGEDFGCIHFQQKP